MSDAPRITGVLSPVVTPFGPDLSPDPERFVRQPPRPPALPTAAWINPPKPATDPPNASEETRQ